MKKDEVFEITDKDILGRIGKLHTKTGILETPCLFPVVHPINQIVTPEEIWKIGFKAIMTNAYLTRKYCSSDNPKNIHDLLNFKGVVATDSGAYQILTYGAVDVTQKEIIEFQERIESDIAVILDIPTGLTANRKYAEKTVLETISRADQAIGTIKDSNILWVGPIQGGVHLDLVARCAQEMTNKPFSILALGSPTQVMEQYMYRDLVRMILTCKQNVLPSRPLHLFGGGHPSMLSLAVSLGCDLFDSASYAIYARKNRYLTPNGTIKLDSLEYFPCSCSICSKTTPKDLFDCPVEERIKQISLHNLNICLEEIRRIKQSIKEGRLWELVMHRLRTHPRLFESIHEFRDQSDFLEKHAPISKKKGIFFFNYSDLYRPEIYRFRKRIISEYSPPSESKNLLILPQSPTRLFNENKNLQKLVKSILRSKTFHICFIKIPYGIVPIDLCDVYPIAQTESSNWIDSMTLLEVAESVAEYLSCFKYNKVILHISNEPWAKKIVAKVKDTCRRTKQELMIHYCRSDAWGYEAIEGLNSILEKIQ